MKAPTEILSCDVLVIGGGGAGCRAAIEAARCGNSVILVNKFPIGRSGTTITAMITYTGTMGQLGICPDDGPDVLFWDVVRGGHRLGNQDLIEVFCRGARDTVLELDSWGMKWDRVDGKFTATRLPGQTYPRGNHRDAITGMMMQRVLCEQVRKHENIRVIDNLMVTKILEDAGRAAGAVALDIASGRFLTFHAGSVVLATGGAGRLYKVTSMPEDARGDGFALAYRAGATMMDMEFQQFYPTCVVFPTSVRGVMVPGAIVYPQGARLINSLGEPFMHKYDPIRKEMATRDMMSRGMALEIAAGRGGTHGGVFIDCSKVPDLVAKHPKSFGLFKSIGMESFDRIEVAPGAHFSIGGIQINPFCESNVPGLYACGEVATGMHGANRCGGNALAETQVFGRIAGEQAAAFARYNAKTDFCEEDVDKEIARVRSFLAGESKETPKELICELQELMYKNAGLIRSEESLLNTLNQLVDLKARASDVKAGGGEKYNLAWIDAIDLQNMIQIAELICVSALQRKESRGAHFRLDYSEPDDTFLKHFCITLDKQDGRTITSTPVIRTREEVES